ncbi:hypothetical protein MK280_10025, partial [Myxococcota bacterium]|nr:hypothetical protein [Myxococcota bacterium]
PDMLFSAGGKKLPHQANRAAWWEGGFKRDSAEARVMSPRILCFSPKGPPGERTHTAWKESIHQTPSYALLIPPVVGESSSSWIGFCSEVIR